MPINDKTSHDMKCSSINLEKNITKLREPTAKTVALLLTSFKKSQKKFKVQCEVLNDDKEKAVLQNKLKRISKELKALQTLKEDDIIVFALTTPHNLMAIAANKRMPITDRLKARISSHKPLSSHLARVKSKLNNTEESETDEQEDNSETEMPLKNLNKIALNNQIVKMRKDIRRAKVHIIHKLTRIVAKLRKTNGRDKIKEKYERKAARWVDKIKCIKELFVDDVSRFALSSNKDMNKLSVDMKSSVQTQSMACIAAHKFVAVQVDNFKKAFPDWEKTIPKILMKKKKKRKISNELKDSVKNSEVTKSNLGESSESEQVESENERSDQEEASDQNEDSDEGSNVKDDTEEDNKSDKEHAGNQSDSDSEKGNRVSKLSNEALSDSSNHTDDYTVSGVSNISQVKRKTKLNSKPNFKSENRALSDSPSENSTIIIKQKKIVNNGLQSLSKIQKPKDIPKFVDPFFITSTNEEYVSSQVPVEVREGSNNQNNNNQRTGSHTSKFSKFESKDDWKSNKFDFHDGPNNKPIRSINRFVKMPYHNKGGQGPGVGNRKERRQALHQPAQEETIEKLHPSWEAKKKLPSIASFQGKKIKFD